MSFGDFLRKIGETFTPPERIRDWRRRKRQYRRYLQGLGQDPETVRSGVRQWVSENPKPQRTKKEKDKQMRDIRQLYVEGSDLIGQVQRPTGSNGVNTATVGSVTEPRRAGFNPLLLLLLIPVVFPKQFKKFFNY
jgi:hypothetical protein